MTRQWVNNPHAWKAAEMAGDDDADASTDVDLNVEIRDRMEMMTDHVHDGSPGEGSADIVPDSIQFTDQSDLSAPGADETILWTADGKLHQRAGAGGSAEELSVEGHTH